MSGLTWRKSHDNSYILLTPRIAFRLSAPCSKLTGFGHLVALSVLAGHLGLVVLAKRRGDRIAHYAFAAAAVLGLSIVFPMLAQGSRQSGQIAWNTTTTDDLIDFPEKLFGSWITGGAVMGLGLLGLLAVRRYAVLLAPWALLPPILAFLTADRLHLFLPRYLLFTIPAWTLLVAAGVTRIAGRLEPGVRRGAGARARGRVRCRGRLEPGVPAGGRLEDDAAYAAGVGGGADPAAAQEEVAASPRKGYPPAAAEACASPRRPIWRNVNSARSSPALKTLVSFVVTSLPVVKPVVVK